LLLALLGVSYIQAVVVGPQQLHNNNKNGYRYNGPAHKYLPSEEPHSHGSNLDSASDLGHGHRQQAFNGPYSSQFYEGQQQQGQEHQQHGQGQQQYRLQQDVDDSWKSGLFQQQQHQGLGNNQQHHQISGHQAYNEGADYQQHQGLGNEPHHQQASNQHSQGHQLNEQSYEPFNSQKQKQQQQQQQHHQGLGHQQHQQQRKESWNSIQGQQPEQYERQEAESWQSSQGHGYQQQQHQQFNQQQHQQQQHNRYGQQQLPLRGDLWQPIRELDLEKLPSAEAIANSHKTITAPGRDVKLVPSYTLSSDFEHDRFIGLDAQDTRLLTQSLPDAYRKQLFSSPSGPSSLGQRQHEQQLSGSSAYGGSHGGSLGGSHGGSLGGSSSDFLQMQSHSYQLPSTHSTHREWPQDKEQQHGSQQLVSGNRQYSASAYAVSPPHLHSSQPSQSSKNSLTHPSRDFQPPYY